MFRKKPGSVKSKFNKQTKVNFEEDCIVLHYMKFKCSIYNVLLLSRCDFDIKRHLVEKICFQQNFTNVKAIIKICKKA